MGTSRLSLTTFAICNNHPVAGTAINMNDKYKTSSLDACIRLPEKLGFWTNAQEFSLQMAEYVSMVLAVPGSVNSVFGLYDCFSNRLCLGGNHEVSFGDLERRCIDGREQAMGIPSEHQRETILSLFSGVQRYMDRKDETKPQVFLAVCKELCFSAEDALNQALRSPASPNINDDYVKDFKAKMCKDHPVPRPLLQSIYSDMIPTNFEEDAPFYSLEGQMCFVEHFPFGTDRSESEKIKKRICWMMLLVQKIGSPHLVEPIRVFQSTRAGRRQGFYSCSRVINFVGGLHTLDCRIMRIENKKKVLLTLCRAVEEIHAQTIFHKNICPQNIIVDDEENVWLAGFSNSRIRGQNSATIPRDDDERFRMVYCASDDASMYERSFKYDIYAMGMTMLEIARGMCFVDSIDVIGSRADIFHILDAKSGNLKDLILRCLAREAKARPSADEIRTEIEFMDDASVDDFHPLPV